MLPHRRGEQMVNRTAIRGVSSGVALVLLLIRPADVPAEEPPVALRVATYNVNWGNVGLEKVAEAIATAQADVVLLQETNAQSEKFLSTRFKDTYAHRRFAGYRGKFAAERFGYLSKFPLRDVRFYRPTHGGFGSYFARCQVGDRDVQLANLHLMPFIPRRDEGIAGLLQGVTNIEEIHAGEVTEIGKRLDLERPTIVAGDLNSLSTFTAPAHLRQLGLIDSLASIDTLADARVTWNWPTRPVPLRMRIDYIFHSPHFRTIRCKVVDVTGSDHHLVVSELAWSEPAADDQRVRSGP